MFTFSILFSPLSPSHIFRPMGDARQIIRSQVAKLEERLDSVNRELMTCIKSQGDVNQALADTKLGKNQYQIVFGYFDFFFFS